MNEIIAPGVVIPTNKFDTCANRSVEKRNFMLRDCCGGEPAIVEGYSCYVFNIDGITPTTCLNCQAYLPKSNGKNH